MKKNLKSILIVALIIGGGFIAYTFLRPEPTVKELLETTERQNSAQVLGDEISLAISQINSLKLDRDVFDDPVFKSLIDHSRPISSEPVGRNNPFASLGSDASAGVRAATSTATSSNSTATTTSRTTNTNTKMATTTR